MKKLMLSIFIILIGFASVSSYTATQNDEIILNSIYTKLDKLFTQNPESVENLYTKVSEIKDQIDTDERTYYLLQEIEDYSYSILSSSDDVTYYVEDVVDGDTITISYLGKESKVRFIGIDTPESYETRFGYKECYGEEASEYLTDLLDGKYIELEYDDSQGKTDKYGRVLAYVIYNGENINNKLIENGYAWEYTYDKAYAYQDLFKASEESASENKLGLWSDETCGGERIDIAELESDLYLEYEQELEDDEETITSECNPNYSGCLLIDAGDYDCEEGSGNGPNYTGKVKVLGYDEFRLDGDNDGRGCE